MIAARQPEALPDLLRRGRERWRGQDRHDAERFEGVTEHRLDGRTRVRLPRLVRLRWALVERISCHVASSARLGATMSQAAAAPATASVATAASGLSADGAGPVPPHLECTTVATRATRLPRLLARSALYRPTRPS